MAPKAKARRRGASRSPSPAHRAPDAGVKSKAGEREEMSSNTTAKPAEPHTSHAEGNSSERRSGSGPPASARSMPAPEAKAKAEELEDTSDTEVKDAEPPASSTEATLAHAEMEGKIVDLFRRLDLNGNGLVEQREMKCVLQKVDPDVWSDDKIDSLLGMAVGTGGGSIQYEQFLKWILSGSIVQDRLLACRDESFWKDLSGEFETLTWQPSSNAELSEDGRCVSISSKSRVSCLAGLLIPPLGACSWVWRIKSSPTDTKRSFLDVGILLDGGDIESNALYARLTPPGSSIITACGTLLDGDVAAELDMEAGLFKLTGLGASGPTCEMCVKEESRDFLLNGVGTLCGQLWRPFIYCSGAAGISVELLEYQVRGRAEPLLRTGISAGRGDAASKALLRKWLPGSGGQPGPLISDIQRILPRSLESGRGALYICAGAAVTDQNFAQLDISAMVRLGHSFAGRYVPGGAEAKVIGINDNPSEDFAVHIDDCNAFIDGHIRNGRSVLVHCGAGVSRSGAAAVAYVMMAERLSYADALALVKRARSWVRPNDGFQEQLKDYERRLEMSGH